MRLTNKRWVAVSAACIVACAALTAGALEKAGNPDGTRVVREMRVIGPVEFGRVTAKTAAEAAALGGKSYEVTLGADETMVDLVKLTGYRPPVLAIGQGADRCGYVVFSVEAERAGRMTLFVANDWWGQLHVNGRLVGEKGGGWNPVADTISYCCTWSPIVFEARKGANELLFRTRPGSCGRWICAFAVGADDRIDFSRTVGTMRREVHSASWGPRSSDRGNIDDDADLKALNLHGWRSHDAPLVSTGQRVVDTHFVFPLLHLDAKDPKNYFFEATDHLFDLVEGCGMKVFYRLGTSIEHSGKWGCNTLDPPDHAKYAEVLAGIVRHYTQGWGGGKKRDIRYWELFNEPDVPPCWRGSYEAFVDLFVTCLKRLKAEFPDLRIGGPAMGSFKADWFDQLLDACAKADVKPDFISFHHYSPRPAELVEQPWVVRRYLDARGLTDCGIVINEWHYLPESGFNGLQMSDSVERFIKAHTGPDGIVGADSAAFAAGVSSGFQATPITQSYYYGCGYQWDWGYRDAYRRLNKPYYAMKMVGELVANYPTRVAVEPTTPNLFLLAGKSAAGDRAAVLVTDYRGKGTALDIGVKGLEGWSIASVTRLDQESNAADALGDAELAGGRLVLRKPAPGSTVYLVSFVRSGRTDGE